MDGEVGNCRNASCAVTTGVMWTQAWNAGMDRAKNFESRRAIYWRSNNRRHWEYRYLT